MHLIKDDVFSIATKTVASFCQRYNVPVADED